MIFHVDQVETLILSILMPVCNCLFAVTFFLNLEDIK